VRGEGCGEKIEPNAPTYKRHTKECAEVAGWAALRHAWPNCGGSKISPAPALHVRALFVSRVHSQNTGEVKSSRCGILKENGRMPGRSTSHPTVTSSCRGRRSR